MATIKDVAERAGVSIASASRVLNDGISVHAETRLLVDQAAEELDYIPNEMARGMLQRVQDYGSVSAGVQILQPKLVAGKTTGPPRWDANPPRCVSSLVRTTCP